MPSFRAKVAFSKARFVLNKQCLFKFLLGMIKVCLVVTLPSYACISQGILLSLLFDEVDREISDGENGMYRSLQDF